jgi:tetratricopeptide (TPR) repeat protein
MNKIKFLLATAALVVATSVSAQDINAKYAEAAAAVKAKNYAAAVPLFEQVIAEGDIEADGAIVTGSRQALPQAVFMLGGAAFQGGKHDEALKQFSKAAELAELYGNAAVLNNARTWISRTVMTQGASAFNAKDYATAAAIFQKGYDANPNDSALGLNLAMSYSGLKDFEKSAPIYKRIIEMAADDSRFEEHAAKARENWSLDVIEGANEKAKADDVEGAIAVVDGLLAVIPGDAAVNYTRLTIYNNSKNYAKVIELGESAAAAQTTPEGASDVWYLVGAAYQNQQNLPQAIAAYGKVTAGDNVAAAKTQITELNKVGK